MVNINEEIALSWLNKGAQPSDTVKSLLQKQGVWQKFMNSKVQKRKEHNANKGKEVKKTEVKKSAAKPVTKKAASSSTSKKKTVAKK